MKKIKLYTCLTGVGVVGLASIGTTGLTSCSHTHSMVKHENKDPTCTEVGYTRECWECTSCHKYFEDEAGTKELSEATVVIAKSSHTLAKHTAVAATCTTPGKIQYWTCDVCHKYFKDSEGTIEITENDLDTPIE